MLSSFVRCIAYEDLAVLTPVFRLKRMILATYYYQNGIVKLTVDFQYSAMFWPCYIISQIDAKFWFKSQLLAAQNV